MKLTPEIRAACVAVGDEPRAVRYISSAHRLLLEEAGILVQCEDKPAPLPLWVRLRLPLWALEHFPGPGADNAEIATWRPVRRSFALHMKVLCAATTRIEGAWSAVCSDVPGWSHHDEIQAVLDHGDPLPESIALVMFPEFAGIPYAR